MAEFKKKTILELRKLEQKELEKYYIELRKYKFIQNIPLKGINFRNMIHDFLLLIVKIDRLLQKEKIEKIQDDRIDTKAPKIYACTHIGGKDIERSFEVIKDSCYLFLGDPGEVYRNSVGLLLYLNGVICLETRDKDDRKIAKKRAIELLKNGGNLLIYPEGAWNISENLPVMKLFNGTVEIAIETNAEIIPIAIEEYNNTYYFAIGKNINYSGCSEEQKQALTNELRDVLSTLKYNIWEHFSQTKRNDINQNYSDDFAKYIVDKCEYGYTVQDVIETRYHDKNVIESDEVFAFQKKLVPSHKNAFL